MKPIFLFVVVSTSATGALLVAMGSQGVGLIVCVLAVGLYEWFRWSDTAQKIAVPHTDERHDVADSTRPEALAVIRRTTTGGAAQQIGAPPALAGRQHELTVFEAGGLRLDA